jgi:predicted pyridoxine 5'-phosphate oxidase superfamily flavin-nucleotide-binding protein
VRDAQTLGYVDIAGNRQVISSVNPADNGKACLFLINFANRRRIRIRGTARVIKCDDPLVADPMSPDCKARPEQVIVLTISAGT